MSTYSACRGPARRIVAPVQPEPIVKVVVVHVLDRKVFGVGARAASKVPGFDTTGEVDRVLTRRAPKQRARSDWRAIATKERSGKVLILV